jgi:rRNA-processing protein FCF1
MKAKSKRNKSKSSKEAGKAKTTGPKFDGPKTVILDTNFVMVPALYGVDILNEIGRKLDSAHSICVPSMVLTELAGIKGRKTKNTGEAAASLGWLKKKIESHEITLLLTTDSVDPWIVGFSSKKENRGKVIVCTNDVELRKTLKKKGVKVISLLGKNKLILS